MTLTPGLLRLFSWAFDEKSTSTLKWELATPRSKKNILLPGFREAKSMIEIALGFQPNTWQILGLLDMKNKPDIVILAGIRSGKSFLFQTLFIIKKNVIVLVIMPTLALMEYQF